MQKNNNLMSGKGENDFQYDPEAEDNSKKYRLPFALCKANGIQTEDWWTPKDAWEALKHGGIVDDVSEEYKEYYRQLKKETSKKSNERTKLKKNQLKEIRFLTGKYLKYIVKKLYYLTDIRQTGKL